MSRERDGATLFERDRICMISPSGSTLQFFQAPTPSFIYMDKSIICYEQPWHMFCLPSNRALLLAQHHARNSPNLNQRNHTHLSRAVQTHFNQITSHLTPA